MTISIPLPPLAEQQRIVARIDALAAKIAEARGLREQAVEETEALARSASKVLFSQGRNREDTRPLADLTTRITKGESPEWQGFAYVDSGVLFIRSENVLWGVLDLNTAAYVPPEFHQKLRRSQLHTGDVLMNLVGASIGRCCVVPRGIGDANVNQAVAVLSPRPELLDSRYLVCFLLSASTQEIIHSGKVETARPNISLTDLNRLALSVLPLSEQRRIVVYLDGLQAKVDALKRLQEQTAKELDALLPSVLDQAFKGQL